VSCRWESENWREIGDGYQFVSGFKPIFLSQFIQSLDFVFRSESVEERCAKPRQRILKTGTIEFDGAFAG
jgi:hypothetical protein